MSFFFSPRTIEGLCIIFGTDTLLTKNMEMYQCQGQLVTFVSRSHEIAFSNDFCSVTHGQIVTIFHV